MKSTTSIKIIIATSAFAMLIGGLLSLGNIVYAQQPEQTTAVQAVFLPMVANGKTDSGHTPTPTATMMPTLTPTLVPTLTPTPTATATPTQPAGNLPANLVGTWYSGNAPLNDFYNPQTGEWRDVSGLGQMYVFGSDGSYTYTGFLRIQTGSCRSEVSVFKQGSAQVNGAFLTVTAAQSKTRTVTICPEINESIVEGSHDPVNLEFSLGDDGLGREQLSVKEGDEPTKYAKDGMAAVLVNHWHSGELTSAGFYDSANNSFKLESPKGMWFYFNADGTYEFGEHSNAFPDAQGCFNEWWTYQKGSISVTSGRITVTPVSGVARVLNSCDPDNVSQTSWLDDERTYSWTVRDKDTDPKMVLVPLEKFVEFEFVPEE